MTSILTPGGGTHRSTQQLEQAIRQYIQTNNTDPRDFNWTKSADDITRQPQAILSTNF